MKLHFQHAPKMKMLDDEKQLSRSLFYIAKLSVCLFTETNKSDTFCIYNMVNKGEPKPALNLAKDATAAQNIHCKPINK